MPNLNLPAVKVLIVEDDQFLTAAINKFLKNFDIKLTAIHTFFAASEFLRSARSDFDLIILDINLPDGSGIDILKSIRENDEIIPVIMLSANTDEMNKVTSLNIGADDYICKPFFPNELVSRINAILRRTARAKLSPDKTDPLPGGIIEYRGLRVDHEKRFVTVEGETVKLRFIEFELLALLFINKNTVVKTEKIIEHIWKDSLVDKKTIEPHISRLRKKLGPSCGVRIEAVTNVGYRFNAE